MLPEAEAVRARGTEPACKMQQGMNYEKGQAGEGTWAGAEWSRLAHEMWVREGIYGGEVGPAKLSPGVQISASG